jgi:hypothetical protein
LKAKELFIMGILQSQGAKQHKLELIFDFWDKDRNGQLG